MSFLSFLRHFGKRLRSNSASKTGKGRAPSSRRRSRSLVVEHLESRELLTGDTPRILASGVLPLDAAAASSPSSPHPILQIQFSEPMRPAELTNVANYLLVDATGAPISIQKATPNATNDIVTLDYNNNKDLNVNNYSLFVQGDQLHDIDDGRALASPGELIAANAGRNNVSTVNIPGNGTLGALGHYNVPPLGVTAATPTAIQLADLDGDGTPDLVVANSGTNQVDIFRGRPATAGGGFSLTPDLVLSLPAGAAGLSKSLVIADFDLDGKADIAVANANTSNVSIFRNTRAITGALSFAPFVNYAVAATAVAPVGLVAADFNSDGYLDLATANNLPDAGGNYTVSVLLNLGGINAGKFPLVGTPFIVGTVATPLSSVSSPTGIAAGALTTVPSAATDLVVSGIAVPAVPAINGRIGYLLNTTTTGSATPSFMPVTTLATGLSVTTTSVAVGPIDLGNTNDIVVTDTANNRVLVFTNTGGAVPSFSGPIPFAAGPSPTAVTLAPVVAAGINDILVANNAPGNSVSLLINTTTLTALGFLAPAIYPVDANPQGLAVANTLGDGRIDELVTANSASNDVSLLFSTGATGSFKTGSIADASFAPGQAITIKSLNHGLTNGDEVIIRGVQGNTAANGTWQVINVTPNTFTLLGSTPNGTTVKNTGTWISPDDLFREANDFPLPGANPTPDAVAVGDLNNDGLPDFVTAENGSNAVMVSLSTGQVDRTGRPFYEAPFALATGNGPVSVAIGDLNGDGLPDIAVANQVDNTVTVLVNNGTGRIFNPSTFGVGTSPTQVALGDFDNKGGLDLAVAHNGGGAAASRGVTVVLNNGVARSPAPFQGQSGFEFASGIAAAAVAVGDFNHDGNQDFVVAGGGPSAPGQVQVFAGDGTGNFLSLGTFATGVVDPSSIALADMNLDGFLDVVVASRSTGATTGGVAVLLSQLGTGLAGPVLTPVLPGTGLASLVVTNVNQAVPGAAPDVFPDVIVATLAGGATLDNVFALVGNGDGTFQLPVPYQVGGVGAPTLPPTSLAATPSPLIHVTTFQTSGNTVSNNLISNGDFEKRDLSGEAGNLLGWQTYDLQSNPGSHGRWAAQTGAVSPLSLVTVPPPQGRFQAMLDQEDLVPHAQGSPNLNAPSTYSGSHALFQDIAIPAGATSAILTFRLYIDNSGSGGFYSNTSSTNLDFHTAANQQVRVDLLNPASPNLDPNNATLNPNNINFLEVSGAGFLQNLFTTKSTDPAIQLVNFSMDLGSFAGSTIRLRFAAANNQGKLIVGVDNVRLAPVFKDTTPPTLTDVGLRNPGFLGAPGSTTPHTTDPTIVGRVNDNVDASGVGNVPNVAFVAFDANNDGNFNGPQDFKTTALDALGNFSFTIPGLFPGLHTVGVEAVDRAGNVFPTTVTFFLEGNSRTEWTQFGPDNVDVTGQRVDYTTVSGRITAVAADPSDPTGNTYYVGTANGGVWKTPDGGASWAPLLDFINDPSGNPLPAPIGGLAVAPSNPKVLYAGTGVADIAFDSRPGVGVFKSVDGGKTWSRAGNSGTQLAGARISKIVVDPNDPNTAYAAVASGGANGPGVYKTTDGGGTWVDVLTPATMNLAPGTALASVTDLVIDPFDHHRLLAGLGNIGLAAPSTTAGLWRTSNSGNSTDPPTTPSWDQPLGGNAGIAKSTLPSGVTLGRVTVAISGGRSGDEGIVYVLIGTPPGNNTPPNVDFGTFSGLYKTSNNFLNYTKVILRQDTSPTPAHTFTDINLFGHDAGYVGAMVVDPADPNVVYLGGSNRWPQAGDPPDHALIRVDTGDMRDAGYVDPNTGMVPNDGDDIQKALAAEAAAQGGFYDPITKKDKYTGEGVSWYDLVQRSSGTTGAGTSLPAVIHALAFDPMGRLLIGTEGGLWRAVGKGYGYDFSSGGRSILGGGPFNAPGATVTSLNANLTISDLTSVALDPLNHNLLYTTQAGTGSAGSTMALQWTSQQLTGPIVNGTNLGIPTASVVYAAPAVPGAAAGTPTTLYRVWQYADVRALQPEISLDGGATFNSIGKAGIPLDIPAGTNPAGMFPALAINPVKVLDNGVFGDELLFGTNRVFHTRSSSNVWDPVGTPNKPLSSRGGLITTLAFAPSSSVVYYAGTDMGEVFVTFDAGADNWNERDSGLPVSTPTNPIKITSVTVDPGNPLIAYVTLINPSGGPAVWRTTDAGLTWNTISGNLPAVPAYALAIDPRTAVDPSTNIPAPNGHIYVATEVGVFVTLDLGTTWKLLGSGLPHVPVVSLTFNQSLETLVAGTQGRGAFTLSTDLIGPRVVGISSTLGRAAVQITFNEAIDPTTLTVSVITLTGPDGVVVPIKASDIIDVDRALNNVFLIRFDGTRPRGSYTLQLQPTITDSAGNKLNQNQNGINGEVPADVYTGRFLYQTANPNTAPVLGGTLVTLPSLIENQNPSTISGVDLASLAVASLISDVDDGAVKGIAVIAVDNTNGTWEYSINSGATWVPFGAVTTTSARLLQATPNNLIHFLPGKDFFGTSSITYRAWDLTSGLDPATGADNTVGPAAPTGGTTAFSAATGTATVTVIQVNQPPSFTKGPNLVIPPNSGPQTFVGWATNISSGPKETGQAVNFIVTASDPTLFTVQPAIDPSGTLTFTPRPDFSGVVTVTVQLHDNGGTANGGSDTSAPQTFTITLQVFNHAPSFTKGPNESATTLFPQSFPNWATNLSAGPGNETQQQTLNFIVSNSNPGLFTVQPAVSANGTLTFTAALGVSGVATVTVQLHDNGGTANGGSDTSPPQTFTISVNTANHAPSFTKGPDQFQPQDAGATTVPNWATNLNPGTPDEANQTLTFVVSNNNPDLFLVQPTIDAAGTLRYTVSGTRGTAVVTVRLVDNGGTGNGGQNSSAPQTFTINVNGVGFKGSPNAVWLDEVYFDLLNRSVDAAALSFWDNQLESDVSRTTVATMIANSTEYRSKFVQRQFQAFLGRAATPADVNTYLNFFFQGGTADGLKALIFSSAEYQGRRGFSSSDNAGFLNAVYLDVFGRPVDTGGLNFWGQYLQTHSRLQTALGILQSPEADGTLVRHLYESLLSRDPQPNEGVNSWFVELQQGTPDANVVGGIAASDEYFTRLAPNHNNQLQEQRWIGQTFLDVVARPVDSGNLGIWFTALERGQPRQDLTRLLVNSTEYRTREINQVYQQFLGHAADSKGLNTYLQAFTGGARLEQIKAVILGSSEYYFGHGRGTDAGFLNAVYLDVLGRSIDQTGLNFWGGALAAGAQRSDVALGILLDPNAIQAVIQSYYQQTLHRSVDPAGQAYWTGQVQNGLTDEYVLAGLIASREYFGRFPLT